VKICANATVDGVHFGKQTENNLEGNLAGMITFLSDLLNNLPSAFSSEKPFFPDQMSRNSSEFLIFNSDLMYLDNM